MPDEKNSIKTFPTWRFFVFFFMVLIGFSLVGYLGWLTYQMTFVTKNTDKVVHLLMGQSQREGARPIEITEKHYNQLIERLQFAENRINSLENELHNLDRYLQNAPQLAAMVKRLHTLMAQGKPFIDQWQSFQENLATIAPKYTPLLKRMRNIASYGAPSIGDLALIMQQPKATPRATKAPPQETKGIIDNVWGFLKNIVKVNPIQENITSPHGLIIREYLLWHQWRPLKNYLKQHAQDLGAFYGKHFLQKIQDRIYLEENRDQLEELIIHSLMPFRPPEVREEK